MTPDTKPVEGLGEAIKCTCLGPGHADRCKIKTLRTDCDALKQRVKVLEEALGKIASFDCHCGAITDEGCAGSCLEECNAIAREVIDPNCGNCGDDGEEPSSNCPTCHGTGFKALAPPVGEKEK